MCDYIVFRCMGRKLVVSQENIVVQVGRAGGLNIKCTISAMHSMTIKGIEWNINDLKEKGLLKRIGPDKGGNWKVMKVL